MRLDEECAPSGKRKRGRPPAAAAAPPPTFSERAPPKPAAPASTRRSARAVATTSFVATADGGKVNVLAQTPTAKRAKLSEESAGAGAGACVAGTPGVKFAVPSTPHGAGFSAGLMSVGKTPGTVRHPKRGEEMYSINGSPLGATGAMDDSDGDEGGGGGGEIRGSTMARFLSSVRKVTAISSAMKTGRVTRKGTSSEEASGGRGGARGDGGDTSAAEELGYELRELADVDPDAGPETVEQAVGALQTLQSAVAAAMARLAGRK